MGGQVELGVVVALVIVAEAVSVVVVFGGEALLPVVGVGRGEGVFAAGVAALHRVADEAADALCNCRMDELLQTSCFHAECSTAYFKQHQTSSDVDSIFVCKHEI